MGNEGEWRAGKLFRIICEVDDVYSDDKIIIMYAIK